MASYDNGGQATLDGSGARRPPPRVAGCVDLGAPVPEGSAALDVAASPRVRAYFAALERDTKELYAIAEKARRKGLDPECRVDIPLARDVAARVEGLLASIYPQLEGSGLAGAIRELEAKYGKNDERICFIMAERVARQELCAFEGTEQALDAGLRVGVAYNTQGIVTAPLEGIARVRLKKRMDGGDYLAVYYAGPIRSAGGTANALSVLIADYLRLKFGVSSYDPVDNEVERFVTEMEDYDTKVTNLQFKVGGDDIRSLVRSVPVEINGDATESLEVLSYKGLERVETDNIRSGVCLTISCIYGKASKLLKRVDGTLAGFGLDHWRPLLERCSHKGKSEEGGGRVEPSFKYIGELPGGRPVFSYPSRPGGFRLRYGRSRDTGFAACGVHPATMVVTDEFIAVGTQLKVEYPGKATVAMPVDSIEGPVVKLRDGSVVKVRTAEQARAIHRDIAEVLFLGDLLVGFGEFSTNGKRLLPSGWCEEWWEGLVEAKGERPFQPASFAQAAEASSRLGVPLHPRYTYSYGDLSREGLEALARWLRQGRVERADTPGAAKGPASEQPASEPGLPERGAEAAAAPEPSPSPEGAPPTPERSVEERAEGGGSGALLLVLPMDEEGKAALEAAYVPHRVVHGAVVLEEEAEPLLAALGALPAPPGRAGRALAQMGAAGEPRELDEGSPEMVHAAAGRAVAPPAGAEDSIERPDPSRLERALGDRPGAPALEVVNAVSPWPIKAFAPSYIGTRMGRPEKAERRIMRGSPNLLFPVGRDDADEKKMRSLVKAAQHDTIDVELAKRYCPACRTFTFMSSCPSCGSTTQERRVCARCGAVGTAQTHCDTATKPYDIYQLPFKDLIEQASARLGEPVPAELKGVVGMSSRTKVPERLEKGILRSKHGILVNKDGTARFDGTDSPFTHFTPREIGTGVERLRQLGYVADIEGRPLESDDQLLELLPQDVLVSDFRDKEGKLVSGAEYCLRLCAFLDDLLERFYGSERFYNVVRREDLVGHLVVTLAPHTSAGIVARIIGFTPARVYYTHPLLIAARRRNADGDEDSLMMALDALLNFSRTYLPDTQGARTMDAPLVLTLLLNPSEIDDEVWDMDTGWRYSPEFYEATCGFPEPKAARKAGKVEQFRDRIGTPGQYEGLGFTTGTSDISEGPTITAYKYLETMLDKVDRQLELARKIRSVDADGVAALVLSTHFLNDIKGNIHTFTRQQLRCIVCQAKYRRTPLGGRCTQCGGRLLLTVTPGSVSKYVEASERICQSFAIDTYLSQQLEVSKRRMLSMFGRERHKQTGLDSFIR